MPRTVPLRRCGGVLQYLTRWFVLRKSAQYPQDPIGIARRAVSWSIAGSRMDIGFQASLLKMPAPCGPQPCTPVESCAGLRIADRLCQQHLLVVRQTQCVGDRVAVYPCPNDGGEPGAGAVQIDVLRDRPGSRRRVGSALRDRHRTHARVVGDIDQVERRLVLKSW